jgi:hypothetical protein
MNLKQIQPIILTRGCRNIEALANEVLRQFGDCDVYKNPNDGAALGTQNAIRYAHGIYRGAKHVLFLEDDLELSRRAASQGYTR